MKRSATLFLAFSFMFFAAPVSAHAQSPPSDDEIQRLLDQCSREQTGPIYEPPELISDGEGGWVCVDPGGRGGISLGWVIAFMLLWAALPMVIAGVVASSRGESVGFALALTFFLGWIGFAIVLFGMRRSASSARAAFAPPSSLGASNQSIADRLRALDDLRSHGLITEDEYGTRRKEILAQT